jgi:hypothetical protein
MASLNTKMTYTVKMTKERLQQMIAAVDNAAEHMIQGQDLYVEVNHHITFKFEDLKPFSSSTAVSRESEVKDTLIT